MLHYGLLILYTTIIAYLAKKIWDKTHTPSFILGIGLIYYWSLAGAWFLIYDLLTGGKGQDFGLHYYHYCEALFPIHLDNDYLKTNAYYAAFIIILELCILLRIPSDSTSVRETNLSPVLINHKVLILICIAGVLISFKLIWNDILIAGKFKHSIYYITRAYPNKYFTLHQLINFSTAVALYIGLISFLTRDTATYIATGKNESNKKTLLLYIFCVFLVEGYLLLIGNKREILFAGILGFLFYYSNSGHTINWKHIIIIISLVITPMIFNNGLRAYSPTKLAEYFEPTHPYEIPKPIKYTSFTMKSSSLSFLFSNEMFASHFSMYGALSHDIPLTYGKSIYGFVYSLIPRIILPNRPETSYEYYAKQVNAMEGEGYTIHHATGWYLNFGLLGIVLGAIVLGVFWTWIYRKKMQLSNRQNNFIKLFFVIGLAATAAQMPSLIRGGPEGYKAFLFEGLIIPALIIYFSSLFVKTKPE